MFLSFLLFQKLMVYASVIIFDFKRPDFVKDAITSIKSNSTGLEFEIILIKSYKDLDIERFLNENKVAYFDLMEKIQQSDYIKTAAKAAKGEIIMFLDDDDIFYPEKIGYLINIFKVHTNLGYYHNNFDTVDQSENIILNRNYKTPVFDSVYIDNKLKSDFFKHKRNLRLLLKIRPDFNSSSIAIRRVLLFEYHEDYDFNVRPDSFLFILALQSSMDIFIDSKVLTHYRIYSGNVSTSYNATIVRLRETFMGAFSSGITMFSVIQTITKGTAYQNYIEIRMINLKLAYNFWSLSRTYKINFQEKIFALSINLIHEAIYIILSLMPAFIKLKAMKIFYHAK